MYMEKKKQAAKQEIKNQCNKPGKRRRTPVLIKNQCNKPVNDEGRPKKKSLDLTILQP